MSDFILDVGNQTKHRSLIGIFCATCEVNFADEVEHKKHYKSDFHSFNLKRRMLQMAPIAEAAFEKSLREVLEKSKGTAKPQQGSQTCDVCWKNFKSAQTFQEHLKSKKHLENQKNPRKKPEAKEVTRTAQDDLAICFFCNDQAADLQANLTHMEMAHGFFLLEEDYLVDREGLLKEIVEQIFQDNACLYCQFVKKRDWGSWKAAQHHMLETGHCLLNPDFLSNYAKFYDYSKALEGAKAKYGGQAAGEVQADDDGWIDIDEEDEEGDELTEDKPKEEGQSAAAKEAGRKVSSRSEWKSYLQKQFKKNALGELVMPDNRVLGVRKYRKYYEQPANNNPFQRDYFLKALREKIGDEETALMVHMDIKELKEAYQLRVLEEENALRMAHLREMRAVHQKNMHWERRLNRTRVRKDRMHNYTLNKHYVDRNMCTS